jgi:hypothetical protein
VWKIELENDKDQDFIMNGITHGFSIIDEPLQCSDIFCENYFSSQGSNKLAVEKQLIKEIAAGHYVISHKKPTVVSALGAVPKKDGGLRIIHDLSRPDGGVNAYITNSSCKYTSVDKATRLIKQGSYLAKIDIKSAFRHVSISPSCYDATGISWTFEGSNKRVYLYDTRLPFGSAKSCLIFQSLTDAVVRMMAKRGHTLVAYLDDFLLIGNNEECCNNAVLELCDLLTSLGFEINEDKTVKPTQKLVFLGVEIDTVQRTLSLPNTKLEETRALVTDMCTKSYFSRKQLECCLGKLNWAAQLLPGARVFMRYLLDLLAKSKHHRKVKVNEHVIADLQWWKTGLLLFNGTTGFIQDKPVPSYEFSTDASKTGGGAFYLGDWFYTHWQSDWPRYENAHINVLESLTVLLAAQRWGHLWKGKRILVRTDNKTTAAAINKGSCKQPPVMQIIRELYWLSVKHGFKLTASFLPGTLNTLADAISRFHEKKHVLFLYDWLKPSKCVIFNLYSHMSYMSYCFLQTCHYTPSWNNCSLRLKHFAEVV